MRPTIFCLTSWGPPRNSLTINDLHLPRVVVKLFLALSCIFSNFLFSFCLFVTTIFLFYLFLFYLSSLAIISNIIHTVILPIIIYIISNTIRILFCPRLALHLRTMYPHGRVSRIY